MRTTILALFLGAICVQLASADEPKGLIHISNNAELTKFNEDRIGHLIDRIDQLEKRIAEIESRPAPKYPTSGITYSDQPTHVSGIPSYAPPTPPTPAYPAVVSPTPSKGDIPDGWQRLHVNGQWFYIIPIEQVPLPKPSNDKFRVIP